MQDYHLSEGEVEAQNLTRMTTLHGERNVWEFSLDTLQRLEELILGDLDHIITSIFEFIFRCREAGRIRPAVSIKAHQHPARVAVLEIRETGGDVRRRPPAPGSGLETLVDQVPHLGI